jgi:hypothetical protein
MHYGGQSEVKLSMKNYVQSVPVLQAARKFWSRRRDCAVALAAIFLLQANLSLAAEPAAATASVETPAPAQAARSNIPFEQLLRPSRNPINAYRGHAVPPPSLANSARLDSLVRDGKLYLSLRDAIDLALEDNLDLVIARYNIPIAQMDVQRTKAGGSVRGVNTGVVTGTPGGGAGGSGAGTGAGGTSSGGRRLRHCFLHAGNWNLGLGLRSDPRRQHLYRSFLPAVDQPSGGGCSHLQEQHLSGQHHL